MKGQRGVCTVCLGIGEKKGGICGEREDTRGYANREPDMVLK